MRKQTTNGIQRAAPHKQANQLKAELCGEEEVQGAAVTFTFRVGSEEEDESQQVYVELNRVRPRAANERKDGGSGGGMIKGGKGRGEDDRNHPLEEKCRRQ